MWDCAYEKRVNSEIINALQKTAQKQKLDGI